MTGGDSLGSETGEGHGLAASAPSKVTERRNLPVPSVRWEGRVSDAECAPGAARVRKDARASRPTRRRRLRQRAAARSENVVADIRSGIVSRWTAENVYAARFDPEMLQVDREATARARDEERKRRRARGRRWEEFEKEWSALRPDPQALKHVGSWPEGVRQTPLARI